MSQNALFIYDLHENLFRYTSEDKLLNRHAYTHTRIHAYTHTRVHSYTHTLIHLAAGSLDAHVFGQTSFSATPVPRECDARAGGGARGVTGGGGRGGSGCWGAGFAVGMGAGAICVSSGRPDAGPRSIWKSKPT